MENNKQKTHICQWCNAETAQSDDECYANPKNNKQQNSIEWFIKEMRQRDFKGNYVYGTKEDILNLINQAKELEDKKLSELRAEIERLTIENCQMAEQIAENL